MTRNLSAGALTLALLTGTVLSAAPASAVTEPVGMTGQIPTAFALDLAPQDSPITPDDCTGGSGTVVPILGNAFRCDGGSHNGKYGKLPSPAQGRGPNGF
jgi:hypothetical protein